MSVEADVRTFHETYGLVVNDRLVTEIPNDLHYLRTNLIEEEYVELIRALYDNNLVEIADACADLVYVVVGTCVSLGIPFDKVWDEVQRSNMSKLDENGNPIIREDGKILKGPNFTPPDIRSILEL